MGSYNHPTITAFIKSVVNNVTIGPSGVQIGYGLFGSGTLQHPIYLNTYTSASDINTALDGIGYVNHKYRFVCNLRVLEHYKRVTLYIVYSAITYL